MGKIFQFDRPFRVVFVILIAISVSVLVWECSRLPPGKSRVDWPAAGSKAP
jgi:hypothetical protein